MNEDLLHQTAEKVLLLWVRSLGHHILEVIHKGCQHLPVDGGDLQTLASLLQVPLLIRELFCPSVEIIDLLRADLGLHRLRLEGLEVAVNGGPRLRDLGLDTCDFTVHTRLLSTETAVGLLPDSSHELFITEHPLHVLEDCALKKVGTHVVLVAVLDVPAFTAEVIGVLPVLLVSADTHHVALAPRTLDDAGQQALVVVVESASLQVRDALPHDFLGLLEEDLRDDAIVVPLVDHLVPAQLPDVDRVLDHVEDHPFVPLLAAALPVAGLVHLVADRVRALVAERVHLEHLPDDDRLILVDDQALLRVELVAVRHIAPDEPPALRLSLHPDLGPLDDRRVLELREDAEHLEHHLPCGVGGVEGLGDGLQDDAVLGEFVHHECELADLAREPIDAEDKERVEGVGFRIEEHLLEAGAVHVGTALGIAVDLVETPVVAPLGLAVGFEPVLLGVQRVLLVILVGRDARVE